MKPSCEAGFGGLLGADFAPVTLLEPNTASETWRQDVLSQL